MLTYPWKCSVLHCKHLGNTWKQLVLMTRHFDYCPSTSEGDNQSVRSSAPVVSRCFPGGYNVKLYISRGRLAWWFLAFLHSVLIRLESSFRLPATVCNDGLFSISILTLYTHWKLCEVQFLKSASQLVQGLDLIAQQFLIVIRCDFVVFR